MRWRIAIVLSAVIAISYLDRQALSVAIAAIQRDIPLTNVQFSNLQVAFLLAYAVMYAGGGVLVDRLGTRRGLLLITIAWSLATMSHALARGYHSLLASRFLLGMGEGGGFPAATKAVAEHFPPEHRATAMGIINGGTAVGAMIAPPLIALILAAASWRWVFVVAGATGLVWSVWWMTFDPPPPQAASPTQASRGGSEVATLSWVRLLGFREVWGLVIAKFLSDAAWYFYLFWLPKYLYDARGFDVKQVGAYAWIPYAAAGLGCLLGGWFSSRLLASGWTPNASRKIALGASAAVMPLIVLVPHVPVSFAIVLFSIAFFGQQSWSTLVMIVPTDLFEPRVVASVAGLVGFGGAMGGVVFNLAVGRILDAGLGYATVFAVVGSFHVAAFLVILATIPRIQRLAG